VSGAQRGDAGRSAVAFVVKVRHEVRFPIGSRSTEPEGEVGDPAPLQH
jgi:hypothetical protein